MRVTIHQPEFVPWLGFFHKVSLADTLILLDDVQFRKNYFQNRNRVRTAEGWTWITVPVEREGLSTRIDEVKIARATNPRWSQRIERTVAQLYRRAPYFESIFGKFTTLLREAGDLLVSLNIPVLRWMLQEFGLEGDVLLSSVLGVDSSGSQRIMDLCLAVGADTYVSGVSGRDYLDLEAFERAGIAVEFQKFWHPVYKQLYSDFIPQISALEALYLFGPSSSQLLQPDWPEHLEVEFT
ncbi:MAG: WbqC family protein [Deltaproteobacteria bacterium]|nr:WbqC family protein [Deltaproteobacteria bacterium]